MAPPKTVYAALPATTRGFATHMFSGTTPGPKGFGPNVVYTNGRSVFIRNIQDPTIADQYSGHAHNTTVAAYSPSGYYIASADVSGTVRIWDTTQRGENPLKIELKVLGGEIKDLAWDSESKRIIVVGQGSERFGHAFLFDSGSSCGEISGHSKVINSCAIKPSRPFRAVTGSDDFNVNFFEGPPFKFKQSNRDHTRFVNCVRFAPDGSLFASVGADSQILVFDGRDGSLVGKMDEASAHKGTIYSLAWSPCSKEILTASGDRTCKLWNVESRTCIATFTMGPSPNDQQVGCLIDPAGQLLSLSLSGAINYLNRDQPEGPPLRVVNGHSRPVMSLAYMPESNTLVSGDNSGHVMHWDVATGASTVVLQADAKPGHSNQVSFILAQGPTHAVSIGLDDTVRAVEVEKPAFGSAVHALPSQPTAAAAHPNFSVIGTNDGMLHLLSAADEGPFRVLSSINAKLPGTAVASLAISPCGTEVAAGASQNGTIHVFTIEGQSLLVEKPAFTLADSNRATVSSLAYSPDGLWLAAGDSVNQVVVYKRDSSGYTSQGEDWVYHVSRITSLAWSSDSKHLASGSVDTHVYVWRIGADGKPSSNKTALLHSHVGQVSALAWIEPKGKPEGDELLLASAGQDGCVKFWPVPI
ncbi:hypothetical protein H696_01600 [Fonticula alba]|uniref:Uncharacterized protein n=1 Tax=Fonticula alba TaxID=691883 RepID=A0A058ZE24_FONAL|nr:hypothetical protein H696_01600 [Fonticula alba]KCV72201.1 hypothetical protein H696_01600 [Fonticula alba]|eukprot:XP_009493779.1 hypothetical protein H696_01600 [Fonticula alba]